MKIKIESAIDSWSKIDVLYLSEVKDVFFSEYNDEEFNTLLLELKLINKTGHSSSKAFNKTLLSTSWQYPYLGKALRKDRFALPGRYFEITQKGIDYIKAKLEKKKVAA